MSKFTRRPPRLGSLSLALREEGLKLLERLLRLQRLADRIRGERRAERRARVEAGLSEERGVEGGLRVLRFGLRGLGLAPVGGRERAEDLEVLRVALRAPLERADRGGVVVLLLVERGDVGVVGGHGRVRGDLLLVGLDPRVDARPAAAAVEEALQRAADPRRARADAEGDEADREHEREQDVDVLCVPPEAREEELVFPARRRLPAFLRLRLRRLLPPRL